MTRTLRAYAWPGNVRELENVIERAVILSNGPVLDLSQTILPSENERGATPMAPVLPPAADSEDRPSMAFSGTVDELQRRYILQVLERTCWVIEGEAGATAQLGLKPSTLRNRMRRLGIHKPGSLPDSSDRSEQGGRASSHAGFLRPRTNSDSGSIQREKPTI